MGAHHFHFSRSGHDTERIYVGQKLTFAGIRERQYLEKTIGRVIRKLIDTGAYPVDAHLDHFLVMKDGEKILVYYVVFERIKPKSCTKHYT